MILFSFALTLMLGLMTEVNLLRHSFQMNDTYTSEQIIKDFLLTVRSGKDPDRAKEFMADKVLAHQMNAEHPQTLERSPEDYAAHVKEFLEMYGQFEFEITEMIAQDHKVYARWKQTGKHLTKINGYPATGLPLIEIASAVYRLENGKIVEYWIQIDRAGFDKQLQQATK